MEEYLTAKQVAKYLQVKPLTVYQWARTNKIPAVKIGRIWRFKKEVIDDFLEEKPLKNKTRNKKLSSK